MYSINLIRFQNWQTSLNDWSVIEVSGADAVAFFHGQTTNDLKNIQPKQAILTSRLNHTGKVQSYFYFSQLNNKFYLFAPSVLAESIISDLNKFIIMDDVELKLTNEKLFFIHHPQGDFTANASHSSATFLDLEGYFQFEAATNLELISFDKLNQLQKLNGFPVWNETVFNTQFVNDSRLNELAVSYKKGCFLGQETAAKIENNRGPATYPFLIKINQNEMPSFSDTLENVLFIDGVKIATLESISEFSIGDKSEIYFHCRLNREYRVEDKKITFEYNKNKFEGIIKSYPLFKNKTKRDLSNELFHSAVEVFNQGRIEKALALTDLSIAIFETADNLEIKGVMLGRLEKFEEAITYMDRLSLLDPKSVMAHTNKSLFLMRLGKITEAEEEKSLATVKSFEKFGEEAKLKKQLQEEKKKKEDEFLARENMFLKVLEIDSEDAIANYGMADIHFFRGKLIDALNYVTQAIKTNPNYSTAYLLLGKIHEALLDTSSAKEAYELGISIATKKGEMMPANEMQSRLNQL